MKSKFVFIFVVFVCVGDQLSIANTRHLVVDLRDKKMELHVFLPPMNAAMASTCYYPHEPPRVFLYSTTWPPSLSRILNDGVWTAAESIHKVGHPCLFELIAWVEENSLKLESEAKAKLRAKEEQLEVLFHSIVFSVVVDFFFLCICRNFFFLLRSFFLFS
jgi:hypothetical protein